MPVVAIVASIGTFARKKAKKETDMSRVLGFGCSLFSRGEMMYAFIVAVRMMPPVKTCRCNELMIGTALKEDMFGWWSDSSALMLFDSMSLVGRSWVSEHYANLIHPMIIWSGEKSKPLSCPRNDILCNRNSSEPKNHACHVVIIMHDCHLTLVWFQMRHFDNKTEYKTYVHEWKLLL